MMLRRPSINGLCGSPSRSANAWCLRWQATHSLVTMAVESHSHSRIGSSARKCSLTPRWVWARCRNRVTDTLVRCPATITNRIGFHHAVPQLPKSGIYLLRLSKAYTCNLPGQHAQSKRPQHYLVTGPGGFAFGGLPHVSFKGFQSGTDGSGQSRTPMTFPRTGITASNRLPRAQIFTGSEKS